MHMFLVSYLHSDPSHQRTYIFTNLWPIYFYQAKCDAELNFFFPPSSKFQHQKSNAVIHSLRELDYIQLKLRIDLYTSWKFS